MENTGGRQEFERGQEVCVLTLDGRISDTIYLIEPPSDIEYTKDTVRADRRGHVPLKEKGTNREIKVHHRRILSTELRGKAIVLESGDKYNTRCPQCGNVFKVEPSDDSITCQKHGNYELHWTGVRPMLDATTTKEKSQKVVKTAKKATEKKPPREPVKVDFDALKAQIDCELYTKKNVTFDHPGVDVKAHVLLYTGSTPRKLCFNSYDGTLGKKSTSLPIDDFVNGNKVKGGFDVKDLEKERAALGNKGYERV